MLISIWFYHQRLLIKYHAPLIYPPPAIMYPPARARTLHSAIGRHGGAAGLGTTSPALIWSNPVYRIVIEDREDTAVSGEERRGEEVPRRPGRSLPPSLFLLHLSCLLCSPSVLPSLGLFPPSIMSALVGLFPPAPRITFKLCGRWRRDERVEVGDGEEDGALSEWRSTESSAGSAGYSGRTAGRRSLHCMYGKLLLTS